MFLRLRLALALLVLGLLQTPGAGRSDDEAAPDAPRTDLRANLQRHCVRCHGSPHFRAELDLSAVSPEAVRADPAKWTEVLERLRSGDMPPASSPQPDPATRRRMQTALLNWLPEQPAESAIPTLRRLTRVEFDRSVRDLLGVEYDSTETFPTDAFAEGLQGIGDVQFVTPILIHKYWEATEQILARAFADGAAFVECFRAACDATPEEIAARDLVGPLLDRAFRRPVGAHEIERRLELYGEARRAGASPQQSLRRVVQSVLLSPYFLFRVEGERDGGEDPWLRDSELAVRLSYFLWSSMPDATLQQWAALGLLHDPDVLRSQVQRMLSDARSGALADGFAAQWLGYEEVPDLTPDVRRFGAFNEALRASAYTESARFFDAIVREDRSVFDLIDSPTTFLDARLALHYGIEGVEGHHWREVTLPDRRRGGVLGMASTLMTTSSPLRTSPVIRGTWILERLLGTPPPPPPPDAGSLPEDDRQKDGLHLRERLERHRTEPRCAACHDQIDPLGLALENYDGIGRWRDEDQGRPVDSHTTLPDGTELSGAVALKDWLLGRKPRIVRTMTEKMFLKAVGRAPHRGDEAALRRVTDAVMRDDGRFSTMVMGLVSSDAFRQRGRARCAGPEERDEGR